VPDDHDQVRSREKDVHRQDERRVDRVLCADGKSVAELFEQQAPGEAEDRDDRQVHEGFDPVHAKYDRVDEQDRCHGDRDGRCRPEQRHDRDLDQEAGRHPQAACPHDCDVGEQHDDSQGVDEAHGLPRASFRTRGRCGEHSREHQDVQQERDRSGGIARRPGGHGQAGHRAGIVVAPVGTHKRKALPLWGWPQPEF
jgi:hypothetical protein